VSEEDLEREAGWAKLWRGPLRGKRQEARAEQVSRRHPGVKATATLQEGEGVRIGHRRW